MRSIRNVYWGGVSDSEFDGYIAERTGFTSMAQLLKSHAERGYRPSIDVRDSFAVELGYRFQSTTGVQPFRYGYRRGI